MIFWGKILFSGNIFEIYRIFEGEIGFWGVIIVWNFFGEILFFESAFCRIFDGMLEIGGSPFYGKILFFLRLSSMGFFKENLIFRVNKGIFEDVVCLWDLWGTLIFCVVWLWHFWHKLRFWGFTVLWENFIFLGLSSMGFFKTNLILRVNKGIVEDCKMKTKATYKAEIKCEIQGGNTREYKEEIKGEIHA